VDTTDRHALAFDDYPRAIRARFPEAFAAGKPDDATRERLSWLLGGAAQRVLAAAEQSARVDPNRFHAPTSRTGQNIGVGWLLSSFQPAFNARFGHKGLMNVKPASDLVLYANLIWELQPKTIIEFGAMQGGSALWFADQLDVLCDAGEVHSYDLVLDGVSPRARHPRLSFHEVDLRDLSTLDRKLIARMPHPWLVVDDAHANVAGLFEALDDHMRPGDYYVIEDALAKAPITWLAEFMRFAEQHGFEVDAHYTDAFGYNMTCAPNGWLRKRAEPKRRRRGRGR